MIRETVILLGIFVLLQPSDAIRCFECSSLISPSCRDTFSNVSTRSINCAQQQIYDLTPIDYCRKIKYQDPNGQWVYLRGCNIKDNLQIKNAQYHFCNTDLCNSANSHRPAMLVILLFTSLLFIKLLRF